MNEISILREIGLSEASRKTHIEAEYLGYMADKNFEKLARLNVTGFIKILKREYDIDFTEWLNEYNAFMLEHAEEVKHKTITISPKIPAYTADGHRSSSLPWMIILLIIAGFAIWFFEAYKYIGNISNLFEDKNRSVSYSNSVVVKEAKNNLNVLKETNSTLNSPIIKPKEPQKEETAKERENLTSSTAQEVKEEMNSTMQIKEEPKIDEVQQVSEQKIAKEEALSVTNDMNSSGENVATNHLNEYSTANVDEFTITPKSKVWVGIINLEDGKKKTLNSEKPITIEANKRQLIVTGHGNITLNIGEENIKFDAVNPKRFHVEKGKVTLITFDEFIALNKGKKW